MRASIYSATCGSGLWWLVATSSYNSRLHAEIPAEKPTADLMGSPAGMPVVKLPEASHVLCDMGIGSKTPRKCDEPELRRPSRRRRFCCWYPEAPEFLLS